MTEEQIENLTNRIASLEIDFIDYVETNPKTCLSWTEARLRALEEKAKYCEGAIDVIADAIKSLTITTKEM